jgi:hypothetical protein
MADRIEPVPARATEAEQLEGEKYDNEKYDGDHTVVSGAPILDHVPVEEEADLKQ